MNNNSISPTNNNLPASNPSAAENQPPVTERCETASSVSDANTIKAQCCLVLALTEAAYELGYRYLQDYEILQKTIQSEHLQSIDMLLNRAEAMPIQIFKDNAYQAIALKKHLDFYLRSLALEKISDPVQRVRTALEVFQESAKKFPKETFYAILQSLLPEEWKIEELNREIDFSNPLALNDMGRRKLESLDLDAHINQIQFLSEAELSTVLTKLDHCHQNIFKKEHCLEALSQFLAIAQSPYVQIDAVSNKILQLLGILQKQLQFVPTAILKQAPCIYSSLIQNSYFFPILRLEILKTMGDGEKRKQVAEYLLTDPSSPVVLELSIRKSSTEETPLALSYLDGLSFIEEDSTLEYLLALLYTFPLFNHCTQFYLFLLGLNKSDLAKDLIQQTENKKAEPNSPEYKALSSARIWYQMGIRNLGKADFRSA